jgi:hypothetical protein
MYFCTVASIAGLNISTSEFSSSTGFKVAKFGIVRETTYHFAAGKIWYGYPPFLHQGPWDDNPILM